MGFAVSFKKAICADVFRLRGRGTYREVARAFLLARTFRPVFTLRLCQALTENGVLRVLLLPIAKIAHRISCHWAAVDLPWRTKIGPGFCIVHGWGLVVSEGALIGANVTLFHGVTLGRSDVIHPDGGRDIRYPSLGSNVWIGPNAIVVGGVNIGSGSRVIGGSFVFKDVESNCMVSGNPAHLIKKNCEPDVMNPAAV